MGTGIFTQNNGLSTINGQFSQNQINLNGGQLFGTGILNSVVVNNGGLIAGGDALNVGNLTINGNFSQGHGGTWQELINAVGAFSKISISGSLNLDGSLNIVTGNGFTFASGETFTIAQLTSGDLSGQFAHIVYGSFIGDGNSVYLSDGLILDVSYNNSGGDILLSVSSVPAPVPVPETSSLFLAGLSLMGAYLKTRKTPYANEFKV